jgi:hypothetical protein
MSAMHAPKKGWRFRSKEPVPLLALTSWFAPSTGGSERVLPAEEEFVVLSDPPPKATAAACRPVRYDELHEHFVDAADRAHPRYAGYYLVIDFEAIDRCCTRVA